jgi:hypothetical protein
MTTQQDINSDELLWQRYVETYNAFTNTSREFYENVSDKVEVVRVGMNSHGGRAAAFNVLQNLSVEELQQLFDELLAFASYSHGLTHIAQTLILSLPHDWLLSNIEKSAKPILEIADYEEYRALLTLYYKIDRDLTRRLAQRAAMHDEPDIKEAGEEYLQVLNG